MLTSQEILRYNRHLILSEFGLEGQEKLKQAKVIVIGAGGLGSPLLMYLAASGIGKIGIADDDVVDESNLQRQILYETEDRGKPKAELAKKKLLAMNPYLDIEAYQVRVTASNITDLISGYDVVVDGSDNFSTRYLVNDACRALEKPWVFGSVFKFEGQVSVFNYRGGPSYRCLYPDHPDGRDMPDCSEAGVLGVLPGIIGILQANEVIKLVTGIGEVLSGKLLMVNTLTMSFQTVSFGPISPQTSISPPETFTDGSCSAGFVREIDCAYLREAKDRGEIFQVIDIREKEEHERYPVSGESMPLSELDLHLHRISSLTPVLFICQSGIRSREAARYVQRKMKHERIFSIKGGIIACIDDGFDLIF